MKRIIKKILLIVFVTATLLQSIQEVEAANRKVIHLQENVYGNYYNQDINIDQHKNTGMDVVEQSVTKLRYLNYFEQEEVEIVEEEFEYLEAIDETTTLYVSKEDSNLKKLVIGTGVVNYQDGESYQPINTEIIAEEPAGISTLAVNNTFYKNKTNTLTSVFGAQIHTDGLEYHKKDTVVEFVSSLIQEGDPVVKGSEIIYPLEQDMVLKYQINRGSVKEELILIAPTSITEYSSTIQVTNGIVKETATGLMIEEHTTPRLYYYYPVMKDANGATGPVTVSYQYDRIVYQLDQAFLANATYPVRITSEIVSNDDLHNVMAHEGLDVSVASNFAGSTIGYLTEEYYNFTGWNLLPEHNYHAFMYLGKQSKQVSGTPLGLTYSLYKIHDEVLDYYDLEAKYIKSAYFVTPINEMSAEDSMVYSCTIQSNLDISAVTFNDMNSLIGNSNVSCNNGTLVKENAEFAKLNITDYVRSLRESSATNSGVLFLLAEEDNYLTLHAHDYYYTDAEDRTRSVPGVEILYYDTTDISDNLTLNDFSYQLRPFVKYSYEGGLAQFVAFGIDGVTPLGSKVTVNVKNGSSTVVSNSTDKIDSFYIYPDYLEIEHAQRYTNEESNYQLSKFFGISDTGAAEFQTNKVYDVEIIAEKNGSKVTKNTWFQLYEVKGFDLLSSVASFYGVPVETLIEDNNLQDQLILEGNVLFIREPKYNKGEEYQTIDLSEDQKREIDAALQGRGVECEFGFEPINLNLGNFLLETEDFSTMVNGEKYTFERTYNSTNANHLGIFGYGWSHSNEYYALANKDRSLVTILLPDGKSYLFRYENGSYVNSLNDEIKLTYNTTFTFRTNHYTVEFNKDGSISKYRNHQNEETSYYYFNALLYKVVLPSGKEYHFEYNEDNLVSSIALPNGKTIQYTYDALHLTSYTDLEGNQVEYQYDQNHNLISWINRNGTTVVKNEYDGEHRVVKQEDALGNIFFLDYQEDKTVIIDGEGIESEIHYDEYKQTTAYYTDGTQTSSSTFEKGLLLEKTVENGIQYSYEYQNNNLVKMTRSDGYFEEYQYDNNHNLIKTVTSDGKTTVKVYDGNNNLIEVTDSLGNTVSYQYNNSNQVIKEIDALGQVSTYSYDSFGNKIKSEHYTGEVYQYTYNEDGYLTSKTDAFGVKTEYYHSQRNELVLVKYADGSEERYEYDPSGNQIKVQDRLGAITETSYDIYGNIVESKNALGHITKYFYDGNQNLVKQINPDGSTVLTEYDSLGRVVTSISNGQTTTYTYNQYGIETTTDSLGLVTTNIYDEMGRVIQVILPNQTTTETKYDSSGKVIEQIDQYGNSTTYQYDLLGRVIQEEDDFKTTTKEYDALGKVVKETVVSADSTKITEQIYQNGQLVETINEYGISSYYQYDRGRLVKLIDHLGNEITYQYDLNGNTVKETLSNGVSHSYQYNSIGNLVAYTNKNGHTTKYTYDAGSNLIEKRVAIGGEEAITTYHYDVMGRLVKEVTPLLTINTFEYDTNGNLIGESINGRVTTTFEYDEYNRLIQEEVNGLITRYEYDTYNRRVKDVQPSGLVKEYQYNTMGQIEIIRLNDVVIEQYEYDNYGRITSTYDMYGNKETYQYNSDQQVTTKTDYYGVTYQYEYNYNQVISERDSLGNSTSYEYDDFNQITKKVLNGKETTYVYDTVGNLSSSTNALGFTTVYKQDGEGNTIEEISSEGISHQFVYNEQNQVIETYIDTILVAKKEYDLEGRTVKEIDGNGNVKQSKYDKFGLLVLSVDPKGFETKYEYDTNFNLVKTTNALGNSEVKEYNTLNQVTASYDLNGNKTSYVYDSFGNVVQTTYPNGGISTSEYNQYNQQVSSTAVNGLKATYVYDNHGQLIETYKNNVLVEKNEYDSFGRLIKTSNALGYGMSYRYNSEGLLIEEVNSIGAKTNYQYDLENQLIKLIYPTGSILETEYDGIGRVVSETVGERTVKKVYDSFGNLIEEINALGNTVYYEYDLNGNQIKATDLVATVQYQYDEKNQLIETIYPDGGVEKQVFDELGRVVQTINPEEAITSYTYDALGNMTGTQTPLGDWSYYSYDVSNNLIKEENGKHQVSYSYDLSNQLVKTNYEYGFTEQYEYDLNGNLIKHVRKDSSVIEYSYNVLNQQIKMNQYTYEYDELGNLKSYTDSSGTTTLEYNLNGNISKVVKGDNSTSYFYNQYGEQEKIVYPDGSKVEYEYDLNGALIKVISNGLVTDYTYNNQGYLVNERSSNGIETKRTYDVMGYLSTVETWNQGLSIFQASYEYNLIGSITAIKTVQLDEVIESTYEYNLNDELIKSISNGEVIEYYYSVEGNKVEVVNNSLSKKNEYNYLNQLVKFTDDEYSYIYVYDDLGNRIKEVRSDGKEKHYLYDDLNQLIEVRDFDLTLTRYGYDALGNRIEEYTSRVHTIYTVSEEEVVTSMKRLVSKLEYIDKYNACELHFGKTQEEELTETQGYRYTNKTDYTTVESITYETEVVISKFTVDITAEYPEVISSVRNGETENYYYGVSRINSDNRSYVYDGLGNVIIDISNQGGILESYHYSDFGERDIEYNPFTGNSSFGYRGEAHTSNGLQYLRARYYSTTSEVFVQEDSYLGEASNPISRNRYTYVLNNPYKYDDPSGHSAGRGEPFKFVNGVLMNGSDRAGWTNYTGTYQGKKYENGKELHGWVGSYYYEHGIFKGYYAAGGPVEAGNILYPSMFEGGGTPSQGGYVNPDKGTTNPTPPKPDEPGPDESIPTPVQEPEPKLEDIYQDIQPGDPEIDASKLSVDTQALISKTAAAYGLTEKEMRQVIYRDLGINELFDMEYIGQLEDRIRDICNQYLEEKGMNAVPDNSSIEIVDISLTKNGQYSYAGTLTTSVPLAGGLEGTVGGGFGWGLLLMVVLFSLDGAVPKTNFQELAQELRNQEGNGRVPNNIDFGNGARAWIGITGATITVSYTATALDQSDSGFSQDDLNKLRDMLGVFGGVGMLVNLLSQINDLTKVEQGTSDSSQERVTLYHYTNQQGLSGILASQSIWPSLKINNSNDAYYGDGQYFSDIIPGTKTLSQLSRIFIGNPWQGNKYSYFIEVDMEEIYYKKGREHVYVVLNKTALDITGRIVSYGKVPV